VTDAYLVLRGPNPAVAPGGEQAPSEGGQDPTTRSRGGQRARQPIEPDSVHRVNLPRRVRAERFGHLVEPGHLSGSFLTRPARRAGGENDSLPGPIPSLAKVWASPP
jgi:hypothetical protein